MEKNVYFRLAEHLDNLPGGFPSTESGVEQRILRRLFTSEEAEMATFLTLIPETPRVVAKRAGISRQEAAKRLESMAKRGLILREEPEKGPFRYLAAQYVIGIWEFHVNDLDEALIHNMKEYAPTLSKESMKIPQLRVIPVARSLTPQHKVLPHEMAEELARSQKKFSVGPCICRREHSLIGKGCKKPEETCLGFGLAADFKIRNGIGRKIDLEETLDILKKADENGLVLQPSNNKDALWICCCCGCCCQVLKAFKRHPKPNTLAATPFVAHINPETCESCGTCVERCQMEALKIDNGSISMNQDRCIGCGLCVSTCPTDSIALVRKPDRDQPQVYKDLVAMSIQQGKSRGKLTIGGLIKMAVKSKVDRITTMG
ncbi:MAG: 4Fe-4S binding protein [Thermodesulfobacteriota bacterium]